MLPGTLRMALRHRVRAALPRRTLVGLVLVAALFAAFLGGSRLASVNAKSQVLSVVGAGPVSFREHVPTAGMDPSVAWVFHGTNLWMGNAVGMAFAILIGAALVALVVPRGFVERVLARRGARGSALGGMLGSALFMCANCATPVSMGYYRQGASLETSLSLVFASPLLNVVGLVTIFFLFPAEMGAWRVVASVAAVLLLPPLVVWLAGAGARAAPAALARALPSTMAPAPAGAREAGWGPVVADSMGLWGRTVAAFGWRFLPWMVAITWGIALLAAFVLTPDVIRGAMGPGLVGIMVASAVGTLLVASTMMEIPVVMGFLLLGMGEGAATAMLVTLPATSLMVAGMVGREVGWRVPAVLLVAVWALGVGVGLLAELL